MAYIDESTRHKNIEKWCLTWNHQAVHLYEQLNKIIIADW